MGASLNVFHPQCATLTGYFGFVDGRGDPRHEHHQLLTYFIVFDNLRFQNVFRAH